MTAQKVVFNRPDYERFDLPSNGIGPTGLKSLLVRPMTMEEEKLLTNKTLVKSGKTFDEIMKAVVGKAIDRDGNEIPVDLGELFIEDEYALMVFIRAISYGIDYETTVVCQDCGAEHSILINLEKDLPMKKAGGKDSAFVDVSLPVSKKVVTLRFPQKKDNDNTEDVYEMLPHLIENASGVESAAVDMWLSTLIVRDIAELRKAVDSADWGVASKIKFTCANNKCNKAGTVVEVDLPITSEFFRI